MQLGPQDQVELSPELKDKIESILAQDKIVLFMKGDRQMPQCGFSDAVTKTLTAYGVEYTTYDILANPDLRSGMKVYSEWPTFPQLYVDKEFVGGCDIVIEMHQAGELEEALK